EQIRASHYQALRGGVPGSDSLRLGAVAGIPQMAVGRIRLASASDLVGKSLAESGLRTRTGALVLSISRGSDNIGSPDPQFELAAGTFSWWSVSRASSRPPVGSRMDQWMGQLSQCRHTSVRN